MGKKGQKKVKMITQKYQVVVKLTSNELVYGTQAFIEKEGWLRVVGKIHSYEVLLDKVLWVRHTLFEKLHKKEGGRHDD